MIDSPTLITPFDFGVKTGNGVPMSPDSVNVYYGHSFHCVCGSVHTLGPEVEVPRDLPMKRQFVAACPENPSWMNLLKVKGIFRVKRLDSICATKIDTEEAKREFMMGMGRGKGLA